MLPITVDSPRNAGTIGPTPHLERAVRTCSLCKAQSPDASDICRQCGADLARHSETAVALAALRANPRVRRIRVIVAQDACPACRQAERDHSKGDAPGLPVAGCSSPNGCRCWYEPALSEIYP